MSKKDYQINVINAEGIKNQNNAENQSVDTNQCVDTNQSVNASQVAGTNQVAKESKPQELKTGLMIGGLITFFLTICFLAYTVYYLVQTYSANDSVQNAVSFIVFVLTVGWISYIPGAICSIISLCLFPFVIKSTSKAQKAIGIIFTILSVLMILVFLIIAVYVTILPNL